MVRELAREERVVAIRFFISDRPGVLGDIAATIGEKGGNILEVLHHRTMLNVPPKGASVDVTIETHGPEHAAEIIAALIAKGLSRRAPRRARAGADRAGLVSAALALILSSCAAETGAR